MKCSSPKSNGITNKKAVLINIPFLVKEIIKYGSKTFYLLWMLVCVLNAALFVAITKVMERFMAPPHKTIDTEEENVI